MKILTTKKRQALIQEFSLILQDFKQADQHFNQQRQQFLEELEHYPDLKKLFELSLDAQEKR